MGVEGFKEGAFGLNKYALRLFYYIKFVMNSSPPPESIFLVLFISRDIEMSLSPLSMGPNNLSTCSICDFIKTRTSIIRTLIIPINTQEAYVLVGFLLFARNS